MESYLKFFELEKPPFDAEGSRGVVLGTKALRQAFQEIKQGLDQGAPRICVGGSQGLGKTSLCRALPKLLADSARLVQIMNPHRPWPEIRSIIVRKLDLEGGALSRASLLGAKGDHPFLVIAIDQAELLSREALEHFDTLMRYKDDDDRQLIHCVLFANLEAAPAGADVPLLWWLDQLTTLQLRFAPIPAQGIHHYIEKRLQKAGWSGGDLFSPQACLAIHRFTGGVPSAVNDVCERALSEASARGLAAIGSELIDELCDETIADALPPFDDTAFEDTSPSMSFGDAGPSGPSAGETDDGMRRQAGISAQSLLDSTPLVRTAQDETRDPRRERDSRASSPRPEPPRLELTNDPFVGSTRADAGPTLELSNDPFVTLHESAPRSTLELADGADLGRADAPGRGSVAAGSARTPRRAPSLAGARRSRKPGGRSNTRLLLLLLLAVLAGASFPQLRDQSALIDRFLPKLPEPVREIALPAKPPEPVKTNTAKPGSVADMLDAIDDAPATLPEDLAEPPSGDTDELANAATDPDGIGVSDAHAMPEELAAEAAPGLESLATHGAAPGPAEKPQPAGYPTQSPPGNPPTPEEMLGVSDATRERPATRPDSAAISQQPQAIPPQPIAPAQQSVTATRPAAVPEAATAQQSAPIQRSTTATQPTTVPEAATAQQSAPALKSTTATRPTTVRNASTAQQTAPPAKPAAAQQAAPTLDTSTAPSTAGGGPVVNEHLSLP